MFRQGPFNTWKHVRTDIRKRITLSFTNDVTRTIWLLTNEAKAFPVECDLQGANLLQALAGLDGGRYKTVEELIPPEMERTW